MKNGEREALPQASQNLVERIVSHVSGTIKANKPSIIIIGGCIYIMTAPIITLLHIV
ncbi:hypothetical protein L4D78_12640 [Photobacterium minamisatsumaniensis]